MKQELLDTLYSKAKWFAVNQIKTVNFKVDPSLDKAVNPEREADLLKGIDNYPSNESTKSLVLGEKYGRKYPVITIKDLNEEDFWAFVSSRAWCECSSIRVTDGNLMNQLTTTLDTFLTQNKVFKFSTFVYDEASYVTRKACMKEKKQLQPEIKKNDLTAICLVYYGTSVEHLLSVLHADGHVGVCAKDIFKQNKISASGDNKTKLKDFRKLCKLSASKENAFIKTKEKCLGSQQFEEDEHKLNNGRKLTIKQQRNKVFKQNYDNLKHRARINFFDYVNDKYGLSRDAYDQWWCRCVAPFDPFLLTPQTSDPLRTFPPLLTDNRHLAAWRQEALSGEDVWRKPPLPQKNALVVREEGKPQFREDRIRGFFDPHNYFSKEAARTRPEVDKWQCICDVCTGDALKNNSVLDLFSKIINKNENDQKYKIKKFKDGLSCSDIFAKKKLKKGKKEKLKPKEVSPPEQQPSNDTVKSISSSIKPKNSSKIRSKHNHSLVKLKSNNAFEKKQQKANEIWWEGVSDYTTPYWIADKEKNEVYIEFRPEEKYQFPNKNLNLDYSMERLEQKNAKEKISERDKNLLNCLNEKEQKYEPLDYPMLKKLGIIYTHQPDMSRMYEECKIEPKIKLTPYQNKPLNTSAHASFGSTINTVIAHRVKEEPAQTKKRFTIDGKLKKASTSKDRLKKRAASFPMLNDDAIATFRRLVPTATLEDKCGAFVRQADDCQREQRKGASSGRKQKKVKVKREEEEEEGRVLEQPGQEETYEEAVRREKRKNPDEEFRRLCLKALDVFIVRSETVMVSNTFKHVQSVTINRHPFCTFPKFFEKSAGHV